MDFISNIVSVVLGGLVGAGLTYWRMRVDKDARKDDLHNAALADIASWESELNGFLSRYNLTGQTKDFRLLFLDFAKTKSEVTDIKSHTRNILRLAKDIRGADLLSEFNDMSEAVEILDGLLAGSRFEDEDLAKSVGKLRERFASAQSAVLAVAHK